MSEYAVCKETDLSCNFSAECSSVVCAREVWVMDVCIERLTQLDSAVCEWRHEGDGWEDRECLFLCIFSRCGSVLFR